MIVEWTGAPFSLFCLWNIWKTRNNNVFNNKNYPRSFNQAYFEAVEFFHINNISTNNSHLTISIGWTLPPKHVYKLNTDGSCIGSPGKGALGEW